MPRMPLAPRDPALPPAPQPKPHSALPPQPAPAPGHASQPEPAPLDTRARIVVASFELFSSNGYDGTTIDAIAEQAGIARRTFFRYFRSKDDVIFPDHDGLLASMTQSLAAQGAVSPVVAVCNALRLVFISYVMDPQVSLQRYRLTRQVDALRQRELSSVRKYDRALSRYLRGRLAGSPAGLAGGPGEAEVMLRADVIAVAVAAAHNAVLRDWLQAGAGYDPMADLDAAFAWVTQTFEPRSAHSSAEVAAEGRAGDDVVVAVFRSTSPLADVMERITRSL